MSNRLDPAPACLHGGWAAALVPLLLLSIHSVGSAPAVETTPRKTPAPTGPRAPTGSRPVLSPAPAGRPKATGAEFPLQAGEIRMEGMVRSVDEEKRLLILEAVSYTTPAGKT